MSLFHAFARRFVFLALLAYSPGAGAAEINAEGAAKLKGIFENFLSYQKSITEMGGAAAKLEYDGAITVEPAGNYYAITLPHARMLYPGGEKLDIGMVSINASPYDTPGQWKMAVAVPTPIVLMDAAGKPEFKVSLGAQKAAGIWDEGLENFAKLDAQYGNILIESAKGDFIVRLPDSRILYDFAKAADGRWSGPGSLVVKNIDGLFGSRKSTAKIAEIKADFSINQYNPAALREYKTRLTAWLDKVAKQAPPGAAAPPDQAQGAELADMLTSLLLNSANGFRAEYAVSGVEISHINPQTNAPQSMKIGRGFFGLDMNGFLADKVALSLRFGYDGFDIAPVPPGFEGILPAGMNIDFAFQNIPIRQLGELGKNAAVGAALQPEMAPLAGLSFIMKTPAILSQAGTTLNVVNNFVGNRDYRFDLNGSARADINAVNSFTGAFKGVFKGLDKLLGRVQAIAADPANPASENAKNLSASLMTMKASGKPETGPD